MTYQVTAGALVGSDSFAGEISVGITAVQAQIGNLWTGHLINLRRNDGEVFHRWSVDQIDGQLHLGRWVVPLVRYNMLPGHETTNLRTGHYIVVYRSTGDGFTFS